MGNEQLEALAQHVRDLWVIEHHNFERRTKGKVSDWGNKYMAMWDGGETYDGKIHKSVWPKIAKFVIENDLQPDVLIHAVFWRKVDKPPTPNMAHGPSALEKYANYAAPATRMEIKTDLIHAFESQKQRALADVFSKTTYYKLNEQTAWRATIAGSSIPLTPLFRYCVARNQNWDDVATDFKPQACKQYKRYAELYNEVWGEWIPDDFKVEALATKGLV